MCDRLRTGRRTYSRAPSAGRRSITTIARAALRLRSLFGNDFHPMVPDSLKGFQPDFREQSELVHSHFVLPLCTALSPLRVRLSETRKGNFARKTNALIRANSQAAGSHRRFFSLVAFSHAGENLAPRAEEVQRLHRYLPRQCVQPLVSSVPKRPTWIRS